MPERWDCYLAAPLQSDNIYYVILRMARMLGSIPWVTHKKVSRSKCISLTSDRDTTVVPKFWHRACEPEKLLADLATTRAALRQFIANYHVVVIDVLYGQLRQLALNFVPDAAHRDAEHTLTALDQVDDFVL